MSGLQKVDCPGDMHDYDLLQGIRRGRSWHYQGDYLEDGVSKVGLESEKYSS